MIKLTSNIRAEYHEHCFPYQPLSFQERAKCLDQVMQQHVEQTMFEDFAAEVYAPVLPPNSASKTGFLLCCCLLNSLEI